MSFLDDYLSNNLQDPEFQKEWENSELEYVIARNIIRRRNRLGLTQHDLATQMRTRQSVISRIESGNQNVTLRSLKSLASVLQTDVKTLMDIDQAEEDTRKYKLVKTQA